MRLLTIYIGGKYGKRAPNPGAYIEGFVDKVLAMTRAAVQGATVQFAHGIWEDNIEPTAIVTVLTNEPGQVYALAEEAKDVFMQDSVLLTKQEVREVGYRI